MAVDMIAMDIAAIITDIAVMTMAVMAAMVAMVAMDTVAIIADIAVMIAAIIMADADMIAAIITADADMIAAGAVMADTIDAVDMTATGSMTD
jgi:hypothetical protein